jgi:hypothetical protein
MGTSAMLDFVGSSIIFAVLILTVARVQVNLNSTMYHNTINYATQDYTLSLSKQIEFDFHKIGYRVDSAKVSTATGSEITFRYYIRNDTANTLRVITYKVDETEVDTLSSNPRAFPLRRIENGDTIVQHLGLTQFLIRYYDPNLVELTPPVTGSYLDSIRAIKVFFRLESLEPVIMPDATRFISVIWEKLMYPRNMGNLN